MVHGNPTWSFYYRNLVLKLRDRYKVIVPDHIGCGLSDRPSEQTYRYTLRSRIDDLATLLEQRIGSAPFRMVVHDWGGMIGLGMALQEHHRLQQLTILNTSGFLLPDSRKFHGILRFARTALGGCLIRHQNAFVRGTLRWGSKTNCITPEIRAMYLAPYDSSANRLAVQRFVQDIPLKPRDESYETALNVDKNLSLIKSVPKQILWGRQDFIFDDAFLNEWKRRCPEAQCHVFENAGHLVLEDANTEICEKVDSFFQRG